jgi:membrane protease YdiL (CAAX protease family)
MTLLDNGPAPVGQDVDWSRAGLWGPPRARRQWGPRDIWVGLAWLLASNLLLAVPVTVWMAQADPGSAPVDLATSSPIIAAGLLVLWAVFAGVPTWASWRHGARSLTRDFGWLIPSRADWRIGLGLGLILRMADLGAGWAAGRLGWTAGDNSDWLFAPRAAIITAFFVLGAAVIAPVLEELFFRGFMMGALNRSVHLAGRVRTVVAVVVSSLVFGALHTSGLDSAGLYLLVATATAGSVLAVLAVRRGNLGASMVTHVVFNTTGVLCAWLVTL